MFAPAILPGANMENLVVLTGKPSSQALQPNTEDPAKQGFTDPIPCRVHYDIYVCTFLTLSTGVLE